MLIRVMSETFKSIQPDTIDPPLKTAEAAQVVGVSAATLNRWRSQGIGPEFVRVGGSIRYFLSSLRMFVDSCERGGGGPVRPFAA